jgi:hypothetical protein
VGRFLLFYKNREFFMSVLIALITLMLADLVEYFMDKVTKIKRLPEKRFSLLKYFGSPY